MFLIGTTIEVHSVDVSTTLFFKDYLIIDPPREIVQQMIDWLAKNCVENFIVKETISRIVAGGYMDNAKAHELGKFNINRRRGAHEFDPSRNYHIKLSKIDDFLFRMTWLDENH